MNLRRLPSLRMRSPRLLPIVIFATVALLLFKGIGILTNGGYVLTGVGVAVASDTAPAPAADGTAPADGTAADASGPASTGTEPTMTDSSPTLADPSPTAAPPVTDAPPTPPATSADVGSTPDTGHGPAPDASLTTAAVPGAGVATPAPADAEAMPAKPDSLADQLSCPPDGAAAAVAATHDHAAAPADGHGAGDAAPIAVAMPVGCAVDAVPMKLDANGNKVPLRPVDGSSPTDTLLLQRLSERRAELDKRDAELTMRESLVQAAEKQMQDRAEALKSLEAQIAALSDQKKSMEDEAFQGVVKMYEAMKPTDAANIFNGLDLTVLLRVSKAMDPRKMSPVLAKMSAQRAQELTAALAADDPATDTVASAAPAAPGALPQIVGH